MFPEWRRCTNTTSQTKSWQQWTTTWTAARQAPRCSGAGRDRQSASRIQRTPSCRTRRIAWRPACDEPPATDPAPTMPSRHVPQPSLLSSRIEYEFYFVGKCPVCDESITVFSSKPAEHTRNVITSSKQSEDDVTIFCALVRRPIPVWLLIILVWRQMSVMLLRILVLELQISLHSRNEVVENSTF